MFPEGTSATGRHCFLLRNQHPPASPGSCQRCGPHHCSYDPQYNLPCDSPHSRQEALGPRPIPGRRKAIQGPRVRDVGGRVASSGHCNPQRKPVFAGQGPYHQPEVDPDHWRHQSWERCNCAVCSEEARTRVFNAGTLPPAHFWIKGQGLGYSENISADKQEEDSGSSRNHHPDHRRPPLGHVLNGRYGVAPALLSHQDQGDGWRGDGDQLEDRSGPRGVMDRGNHWRRQRGVTDRGFNGCGAFFPTEVPQKDVSPHRWTRPCTHPHLAALPSPETSRLRIPHGLRGPEESMEEQRGVGQVSPVRDQIRQVVAALEDVLGALKQVHLEMKEVVEQIDRLTVHLDLSEEQPHLTIAGSSADHCHSALPGGASVALPASQKPALVENCLVLRSDTPSPVHKATVVKTCHFTPKLSDQERPGSNGHPRKTPAHLAEPRNPISPDQRPPLYPQGGRCGQGHRSSSSMV